MAGLTAIIVGSQTIAVLKVFVMLMAIVSNILDFDESLMIFSVNCQKMLKVEASQKKVTKFQTFCKHDVYMLKYPKCNQKSKK